MSEQHSGQGFQPLGLREIEQIIPHRFPFLLIDRISAMDLQEKTITAWKAVSGDEWFFQGHFPSNPVMPGVLIVEAMAQAGCVLLLSDEKHRGKTAYFAGIQKMRFHKKVQPGTLLELHCTLTRSLGGLYFAAVEAKTEGETAAKGEILCGVQ